MSFICLYIWMDGWMRELSEIHHYHWLESPMCALTFLFFMILQQIVFLSWVVKPTPNPINPPGSIFLSGFSPLADRSTF
jgi:hypothetical protein